MTSLRELRLKKEVQERVLMNDGDVMKSFEEVYEHLFDTKETLLDHDRLLQAIDVQKDITIVRKWINEYKGL